MPWSATIATAAVLINDTLSIENIVFKVISIAFVLEADDMLARLFLPPSCQLEMNHLVAKAKKEGVRIHLSSWLWTRFLAAAAVIVLCVLVIFPQPTMSKMGITNCDGIIKVLIVLRFVITLITDYYT